MDMLNSVLMSPNQEYLEMNYVKESVARGINSQVIMKNLHNGFFRITEGRVGIRIGRLKPKSFDLPMEKWEEMYSSKIRHGYMVTKQKEMKQKEINKNRYLPISDEAVREIYERLCAYANKAIENNFTVKVDDVSDEMLEFGKSVLDELALKFEDMSVAEFNQKLKKLYAAIPRRMDNLSKFLAQRKGQFNDIIATEQDLFNVIYSQVRNSKMEVKAEKTVLESLGITCRAVTAEEEKWILDKLESDAKRYVRAWKFENLETEKKFQEYCKREALTEAFGIDHLFHGSKNENFLSIISNGLTINPTGVVITGKAYGNGTYFAPAARKAIGYTSKYGAKWTNGDSPSGFLGIYKVATGKRYNGSHGVDRNLSWVKLQKICPGAHCTWAEARYSGFRMDEVIVYQDCQSTIEYLVEIGI